jgi:phosphoribosyl 1,2-cyclic phosphodiesterase
MRVVSICSSSKANCTYIESGGKGFLVDIGCTYKALCSGLALAGRSVENINAVFITHEHSDHIGGLSVLTKQLKVPVYASEGTMNAIIGKGKAAPGADLRLVSEAENAPLNVTAHAFRTPHDSAESTDFTFYDGENKIAVCTDLGKVTDEVRGNLLGCRFVLLESNYDPQMLTRNLNYSYPLKERIRSDRGHLSNGDCAAFARELVNSGTVSILLGHLSQNNNTPELATGTTERVLAAAGATRGRDYVLDAAAVTGNGRAIAI